MDPKRNEPPKKPDGDDKKPKNLLTTIIVSIAILLPGFTTATAVSTAVTVAETVIVGDVPETYTYFSTMPETAP